MALAINIFILLSLISVLTRISETVIVILHVITFFSRNYDISEYVILIYKSSLNSHFLRYVHTSHGFKSICLTPKFLTVACQLS